VKRSAAQYAVLSRLLDEALGLEESARAQWLAQLPDTYSAEIPVLDAMLTRNRAAAARRLANLELALSSSARGVRALCTLHAANAAPAG
jgi:hypothetical protein